MLSYWLYHELSQAKHSSWSNPLSLVMDSKVNTILLLLLLLLHQHLCIMPTIYTCRLDWLYPLCCLCMSGWIIIYGVCFIRALYILSVCYAYCYITGICVNLWLDKNMYSLIIVRVKIFVES